MNFSVNRAQKVLLLILCLFEINCGSAQQYHSYKTAVIAFYNCENFYDTANDPLSRDEEFTPKGEKHYSSKLYAAKLGRIAEVISKIGTDDKTPNADGPAILGLAEIENKQVLNDLINHPTLKKRNYQFIHFDSKDQRGIDVALLYNPAYFSIENSQAKFVNLRSYYTRDILWVKGKLDGEEMHIFVNHWPSRIGSEKTSEPFRIIAAGVLKKLIDSIHLKEGSAKIIIMGDFNDNPDNKSIHEVLNTKEKESDVTRFGLFNPFAAFFKNGIGTIASLQEWSLFDQIIVSQPWTNKHQPGFFFYQAQIFNRSFLTEKIGKNKGHPQRTWDGNLFLNGYSDHFPVYITLLKKIQPY